MRPSRAIEHAWEEVTVGLRVPEGAPQRTFGWIATGYPTPPKRLTHLLTRYKEHAVPFEIDPSWVNLLPPTMVWAREDTEQMAPSLVQSIPLDALPRVQRAMLLCGPTRAETPALQTLLLPEKKTEHEYLLHWWISDQHTILEMPARSGTWEQLFPPLPDTEATMYHLPVVIPQQTFPEAKAVAIALADGPSGRRWNEIDGETSLVHRAGDASIETKLIGTPLLSWFGLSDTTDNLRSILKEMGLDAVLMLHVAIGAVLEQTKRAYVSASIDELITAIGWEPRSTAERIAMRQRVWHWIAVFVSTEVIGCRPGRYTDPTSKQILDMTSRDPILVIAGRRMPVQLASDDSQPPLEVTFGAGAWLDPLRGNRQVLSYFGNVRKLAVIPPGQTSGKWARALGLALQQCWRERASRAHVSRVGEDNHITIYSGPVTRRQLLTIFTPDPSADEILSSEHPKRAQTYWDQAIRLLKNQGIIGHYRELATLGTERKGWAGPWLDQPLDIRPKLDLAQDVAEIAERAKAAKKTRAKHPPKAIMASA